MRGKPKFSSIILLLLLCLTFLPISMAEADEPQVVRVGYWQKPNFQEGGVDGARMHGMAYDYLQEISAIANWKYEYVFGTLDECLEKMREGKIDLIAGLDYTPERAQYALYSSMPLINMPYYIFAPSEDALTYGDYDKLNGKTIALQGDSLFEQDLLKWENQHGYQLKIKRYPTTEAAQDAFARHETDLLLTRGLDVPSSANVTPVVKISNEGMYIAVSKNRPDLQLVLNQSMVGLWQTSPYFTSSLIDAYFRSSALRTQLTAREREWLSNHPVIKVGYLEDYAPFCYTNSEGEVDGLLADILGFTWQKYGIQAKIEYHAYKNYQEMMQAVRDNQIDMAFPTNSIYWDSEQGGHYQSTHVDDIKVNLVYSKSQEITPNTVFAVSRRSPVQERYMKDNYPDNGYVYYNNVDECLKAVREGKADATMINSYEATLKVHDDSNLKTERVNEKVAYCIAISPEDSPLTTIINRGITGYGHDAVTDSLLKHTEESHHFTTGDFVAQNRVVVALIATALVFVFSLLFMLARNRHREEELANKMARTDSMTGLKNRRAYEEFLKKLSQQHLPNTLTCLVVDLNGLKRINDTLGHDAGDEAIIACADSLREAFSGMYNPAIFRTGGDEFVVIANMSVRNEKRIRDKIAKSLTEHRGKYVSALSASCGFVMSGDFPDKTIYELVRVADGRMYAEKEASHMCRPQ